MVCSETRPSDHAQQGSMQTAERTLTRRKPKQQRSRQTVDFVLSADGQQILAGYGFGVGEPR